MRAPQGEPIPAAGWWPLCKPGGCGLSLGIFSFLWCNYRHLNSKMCVCVTAQMETCRGAIHRFKLNTCFWEIAVQSVFFRREFRFERSSLSNFPLLLFCIDFVCVCVCFQVQLCHPHQIFHIMVFVLVHSMLLFLSNNCIR